MENEIAQGIDKTPTLQPLKSSLIHNKSHTHSNLVFHPPTTHPYSQTLNLGLFMEETFSSNQIPTHTI
jgi:hypothetical protein